MGGEGAMEEDRAGARRERPARSIENKVKQRCQGRLLSVLGPASLQWEKRFHERGE